MRPSWRKRPPRNNVGDGVNRGRNLSVERCDRLLKCLVRVVDTVPHGQSVLVTVESLLRGTATPIGTREVAPCQGRVMDRGEPSAVERPTSKGISMERALISV